MSRAVNRKEIKEIRPGIVHYLTVDKRERDEPITGEGGKGE